MTMTDGVLANLNLIEAGAVELGDRIIEVNGTAGPAHELLTPLLQENGTFLGELRITLLRPILVQPVVVQMQPGNELGLDVDLSSTNVIQFIDKGLISDLNEVYPGSIEVGDRIVEVDGKRGNAVEQIRAWVEERKGTPGNMQLKVTRRPRAEPNAAWNFSVMIRVRPGESLGSELSIDDWSVQEIEATGAIASLNKVYPGAIQNGDRIISVDGIPCPKVKSSAELASWFQGRKLYSKDIPRDLRLTLQRPVETAPDVSVLPPFEYCLTPDDKVVDTRLDSKASTAAQTPEHSEDSHSAGSTTDLQKFPDTTGTKVPSSVTALTNPVTLDKFVDSKVVDAPPQPRWYQIFNGPCCTPSNTDLGEQQVAVVARSASKQ